MVRKEPVYKVCMLAARISKRNSLYDLVEPQSNERD